MLFPETFFGRAYVEFFSLFLIAACKRSSPQRFAGRIWPRNARLFVKAFRHKTGCSQVVRRWKSGYFSSRSPPPPLGFLIFTAPKPSAPSRFDGKYTQKWAQKGLLRRGIMPVSWQIVDIFRRNYLVRGASKGAFSGVGYQPWEEYFLQPPPVAKFDPQTRYPMMRSGIKHNIVRETARKKRLQRVRT